MMGEIKKEKKDEDLRELFAGKRIGVLMGGMSSERDVSLKTGAAIAQALRKKGYTAVELDVDKNVAEILRLQHIDVAFLALHGTFGEDGTVQGLLEILGIPYTGSGVLASALAINKVASKKIFAYHGLPTPAFQTVCRDDGPAESLAAAITLPLPFVVKPSEEGSTIGISIVREKADIVPAVDLAVRYGAEILIEAFVSGRELTVGVLNGRALPLVEICTESGFYDYEAKYHSNGKTRYIVAPPFPRATQTAMQAMAVQAFHALGCSGAARVDFIVPGEGTPCILEINTIPGMTETSLLPKAAGHAGIDFESLVESILWSARVHKKPPEGV